MHFDATQAEANSEAMHLHDQDPSLLPPRPSLRPASQLSAIPMIEQLPSY